MKPKPFDPSVLLPGDFILHRPSDWIGWWIAIKTWAWLSHIECYIGGDQSMASRYPEGVLTYQLRTDHVARVLRPNQHFDLHQAKHWFYTEAVGQGYDLKGFLVFFLAAKHGSRDKMFCSELASRFARNGGLHAFAHHWDADKTAPADFMKSPTFDIVWDDGLAV